MRDKMVVDKKAMYMDIFDPITTMLPLEKKDVVVFVLADQVDAPS